MYRVTLTAAPLSPRAATMKARHRSVRTAIPAPAHRIEWNRAAMRAPAFVPPVMSSRLLVGNSGSISLLGGICHSAVGSPLRSFTYHSKGLFYENRTFSSVGNLFLLPLLLPPPDVLICSLQGHGQLQSSASSPTQFQANIIKSVQMAPKKSLPAASSSSALSKRQQFLFG